MQERAPATVREQHRQSAHANGSSHHQAHEQVQTQGLKAMPTRCLAGLVLCLLQPALDLSAASKIEGCKKLPSS